MKYFAFKDKKTDEFVTGTDYRYSPPRQIRNSEYSPIVLIPNCDISDLMLKNEITKRHINLKRYKIVTVEIKEAE